MCDPAEYNPQMASANPPLPPPSDSVTGSSFWSRESASLKLGIKTGLAGTINRTCHIRLQRTHVTAQFSKDLLCRSRLLEVFPMERICEVDGQFLAESVLQTRWARTSLQGCRGNLYRGSNISLTGSPLSAWGLRRRIDNSSNERF